MTGKITTFEIILLIVSIAASILGFRLINSIYSVEQELSWLMLISIFSWLTLLVMFILLSSIADISRKQYEEIKQMNKLLKLEKKKII